MASAAAVPDAPPPLGWRELLRHRRFVAYLATLSVGDIGYSVYAVAAPWLAYTVTHDLFDVGAVLAAEVGLYAFSFVAAPFADRVPDKRTILLWGYSLQGVVAFSLGILTVTGHLTFPLLLGAVSTISFVWTFTWCANNAIPPLLLPQNSLFRANGLAGAFGGGNQVTGFTVGGALILFTGPGGAMLLYGGLNVVAAVLAINVSTKGTRFASGSVLEALREGWRTLVDPKEERPLARFSFYVALQGFLAPGPVIVVTELAAEVFVAHQFAYGVLFVSFVLGGSALGVLMGQVNPRRSVGRWLLVSPVVGAGLIFLAPRLAPDLLPSIPVWFGVGGAMLSFETLYMTYLQASSPPDAVARNTANVFFFRGISRAAGALVLGALATFLVAATLGDLLAGGLLAVAAVGLVLGERLRTLKF